MFGTNKIKLYLGKCEDILEELIKNGVKVDAIITDVPQGITNHEDDIPIEFNLMWEKLYKIKKSENTPIILFTNQPYTSELICSNLKDFKYMKYWQKDRPSCHLNAKKQPLRDIEEIAIFYEKQCYYNPLMKKGKPCNSIGKAEGIKQEKVGNYNKFKGVNRISEEKYPRSLMVYKRPHPPIHQTQKPIELLEDLILTYSKEGDIILDFTMGSGSTGVAAIRNNRNFIGIEKNKQHYYNAVDRLNSLFLFTNTQAEVV